LEKGQPNPTALFRVTPYERRIEISIPHEVSVSSCVPWQHCVLSPRRCPQHDRLDVRDWTEPTKAHGTTLGWIWRGRNKRFFVIFAGLMMQVAPGACYIAPDASPTMLSSKAARFSSLAEAKAFVEENRIALNGHTYIGLKDFIVSG
jgi:hypothetical protein